MILYLSTAEQDKDQKRLCRIKKTLSHCDAGLFLIPHKFLYFPFQALKYQWHPCDRHEGFLKKNKKHFWVLSIHNKFSIYLGVRIQPTQNLIRSHVNGPYIPKEDLYSDNNICGSLAVTQRDPLGGQFTTSSCISQLHVFKKNQCYLVSTPNPCKHSSNFNLRVILQQNEILENTNINQKQRGSIKESKTVFKICTLGLAR